MSKNWSYAKMSKEASQNGGPDRYKEKLLQKGEIQGNAAMIFSAAAFALEAVRLIKYLIDKKK